MSHFRAEREGRKETHEFSCSPDPPDRKLTHTVTGTPIQPHDDRVTIQLLYTHLLTFEAKIFQHNNRVCVVFSQYFLL